jgi:hypothetical protein
VLKVVRVFEIISPQQAAALNSTTSPAQPEAKPAPAK